MFHKIFLILIFSVLFQNLNAQISREKALYLSTLPLKCIEQEYPNKPGETLEDSSSIGSPKEFHPAFYGCYDWHSAVHGHWSLVYLLELYPDLSNKKLIIDKLTKSLTKENIQEEIKYFNRKLEKSFERTYGWAWLFKLQQSLNETKVEELKHLAKNLQPLTDLLSERLQTFLPKLIYPLRVGTHSNTAFGLSFAFEYAHQSNNKSLQDSIRKAAIRFFISDKNCPINWEPSGTDFLSPCMEEMNLMRLVLDKKQFLVWLKKFQPELFKKNFQWLPGKVGDREDGHLVHLDGLNFSRAWCFYPLAKEFPKELGHLKKIADEHFNYSFPQIVDGNYEGEHWLASFALHAIEEKLR